jgi:chaperonin cofactor prefoldin
MKDSAATGIFDRTKTARTESKLMMIRTLFCLLVGAAWAMPAELPVTQVVLYKHGLGFFERAGTLGPGESARLDFDAGEMNDVLKSLTIDERGGRISGLRYDSLDPLSHTLAQFPFQIGGAQPLSAMLDQLKGARIELKFAGDTVSGVVVNAREIAAAENQPAREQLTLLLDSGDLRNLDLGAAAGIRFSDPKLQQQFRDYLAALAAARSKERRSVYIDSSDAKERQVTASYMVPAPVWKSSYRLILPETGKPVLEGWAIVDNTTSEDWTKVRLSLVSGRPISFISQLYAPRYVGRQSAELPEDAAAQPVLHGGAYVTDGEERLDAPGSGGGIGSGHGGGVPRQFVAGGLMAPRPAAKALAMMEQAKAPAPPPPMAAPSSIVAGASADAVGELFEYRIAQPVTIKKNESAMLPFLQDTLETRKLLIWSDRASEHPTNAAELTNSTGKTLDGGPVTVYDGGAYGGEALMETLKAGDKRLISYAVDLGTRITTAFDSKQEVVREVHLNSGMLRIKTATEEVATYTARNVDQKAKTLIIEHPLRYGYTLLSQKPTEKTAANYRFEVPLAAGATKTFAVSEERIDDNSYAVTNLTPDILLVYVRNRALTEEGRKQLSRIATQKQQIAANNAAIDDAERQVKDLGTDEDRLRRNIGTLHGVNGQEQQVQDYARQLGALEQKLTTLRDRQAELQKKKTSLQHDLDEMVSTLSF